MESPRVIIQVTKTSLLQPKASRGKKCSVLEMEGRI